MLGGGRGRYDSAWLLNGEGNEDACVSATEAEKGGEAAVDEDEAVEDAWAGEWTGWRWNEMGCDAPVEAYAVEVGAGPEMDVLTVVFRARRPTRSSTGMLSWRGGVGNQSPDRTEHTRTYPSPQVNQLLPQCVILIGERVDPLAHLGSAPDSRQLADQEGIPLLPTSPPLATRRHFPSAPGPSQRERPAVPLFAQDREG